MNQTTTSKGEQAKSQLIAAALAQFGEYGLHATTRDIAAQAGQNIAAITYYFGSKEDLYLACAGWIADFININLRAHVEAGEKLLAHSPPDRAAIRDLLLTACRNMTLLLTHDDTVNLSKFISREQLSPTAAYQLIHDRVIAPMHDHLTQLIAAYTGRDPAATETILHAHALLGEIIMFRIARETILLRTGWQQFNETNVEQICAVIACHIDLLLQGLTQGASS
ncbi:transcriptional regulator [Pluralibacter gergoviae]|uniref:transcriptional regulator CecR n=1 Tax=Pluralibacter gergoviae TaxID=61647 RepID=UPI0005ECB2BE|nr:transcriptional regulator CecR [Pluralibacter gergoviae]EKV6246524.1 transcriptional regulator CecR [Pluralibacter gergoviae]KJM67099.1 transcriptional regulator [Pluralibacter gergoviae]KMK20378.1 transcriptional regulator [Pluralibacter gergoviae]OUR01327.1 transcriptional regulator [Pluralibacter gergoviae]